MKVKIGIGTNGPIIGELEKVRACNFCRYFRGYGLHAFTGHCCKLNKDVGGSDCCSEFYIKPEVAVYDEGMDKECIELCNRLNSLSNIETTESCCGHCKEPYMIFFECYSFIQLGKLYRAVDRNYSDGKWRIECCCSDTKPVYGFMLRSKEPFTATEEMMESVNHLIENIDYWEDPRFNDYFKNYETLESTH